MNHSVFVSKLNTIMDNIALWIVPNYRKMKNNLRKANDHIAYLEDRNANVRSDYDERIERDRKDHLNSNQMLLQLIMEKAPPGHILILDFCGKQHKPTNSEISSIIELACSNNVGSIRGLGVLAIDPNRYGFDAAKAMKAIDDHCFFAHYLIKGWSYEPKA